MCPSQRGWNTKRSPRTHNEIRRKFLPHKSQYPLVQPAATTRIAAKVWWISWAVLKGPRLKRTVPWG